MLKEKLAAAGKALVAMRAEAKRERAAFLAEQSKSQTELRWHLPAWASMFAQMEEDDDVEEQPLSLSARPPGQEWRTFVSDLTWHFKTFFIRVKEMLLSARSGECGGREVARDVLPTAVRRLQGTSAYSLGAPSASF